MLVVISTSTITTSGASSFGPSQSGPILTVDPSSVVIKVGDSAIVSVSLSDLPVSFGTVCFRLEGFPTSGFITSIVPTCVNPQQSGPASSVFTVEATPAAAPQSFTAFVVANSSNWSKSVEISITVEPAISTWIPWSIILAFVVILTIPLAFEIKKTRTARQSNLR
jgi:hypothetical protein